MEPFCQFSSAVVAWDLEDSGLHDVERRINTQMAPWEGSAGPSTFPPLGRFNRSIPLHASPQSAHYMVTILSCSCKIRQPKTGADNANNTHTLGQVDLVLGSGTNTTLPQTVRLVLDTGSGDCMYPFRSRDACMIKSSLISLTDTWLLCSHNSGCLWQGAL